MKLIEEFQQRTKTKLYDERRRLLKQQDERMKKHRRDLEEKKLAEDSNKTDFKENEKKL